MSTALITNPEDSTWQLRLAHNAEAAFKSGSSWVVAVFVTLAGLYQALPDATQLALVNTFPILKGYGPFITFALAWLVARLKPSNTLTGQSKAMVEELTRARFNDLLRSRGIDPAAPVATTTVVPAAPVASVPDPTVSPELMRRAAELQEILRLLRTPTPMDIPL